MAATPISSGNSQQEAATSLPVLLTVFKRPDTTRQVMEALSVARPPRLYVAADGHRQRPGERELCEETRRIATDVNWPCDVKTLFRETNLGCRVGMSTAIDWFFEHEEQGVILEDDCVPSVEFFSYASELLEKYKDDQRIMTITGCRLLPPEVSTDGSYYFSRHMMSWGWASWRRAWALYDRDMSLWPQFRDSGGLRAWSDGEREFEAYWRGIFDQAAAGQIDSWAYRWLFSCWAHGGLTCISGVNLISNVGFGADGTHTRQADHRLAGVPTSKLQSPIRHPAMMVRDVAADHYKSRYVYGVRKRSALAKFRKAASRKLRGMLAAIVAAPLHKLRT